MKSLEFYEPPFWSDGVYIWSNNGNMALMLDSLSPNADNILSRTCEILNGTSKPQKVPALEYIAPDIMLNGETFLTVRGWGGLKASGIPSGEAAKIQDEFGSWVVSKLKGQ